MLHNPHLSAGSRTPRSVRALRNGALGLVNDSVLGLHVPSGGARGARRSDCGPTEQGRGAREFFTSTGTVHLRASRAVAA